MESAGAALIHLLRSLAAALGMLAAACADGAPAGAGPPASIEPITPARVRRLLEVLAADSMEGRRAATRGYARAAAFVAAEMKRIGLAPAGDSGYFQRVAFLGKAQGRLLLLPNLAAWDTVPVEQRVVDVNVLGIIPGSDPELRDEVLLVGAHLDGLGILANATSDSIYNGADDDASGVVTVLEAARVLAAGARPRRTVIFAAFTAEESGGLGSRWYLSHPARPIANTVAQLEVEMVARPDSLAGGSGKAWLTGYERSTMGEMLSAAGIPVAADPRPMLGYFQRSDNYRFALAGIPAHTVSSYGNHKDYHQPGDEVFTVDFDHFASVVAAASRAVRLLADRPRVEWKPGSKPETGSPRF